MIVLDVNLLLYVYDVRSPEHQKAREWFEDLMSNEEQVGLPWQTIAAFLRIATFPRSTGLRLTLNQAVSIVDQWLDQPNVRLLHTTDRHWSIFRSSLLAGEALGKLAPDAQLAALTIEHGGILYTNDRYFARFPGLRWTNPLL